MNAVAREVGPDLQSEFRAGSANEGSIEGDLVVFGPQGAVDPCPELLAPGLCRRREDKKTRQENQNLPH